MKRPQNISKSKLTIKELPEFRITKGEVLYGRYCSFCHGESGDGDGLNAYSIPVKPRNFNDQAFMALKSDVEFEKVILSGGGAPRGYRNTCLHLAKPYQYAKSNIWFASFVQNREAIMNKILLMYWYL